MALYNKFNRAQAKPVVETPDVTNLLAAVQDNIAQNTRSLGPGIEQYVKARAASINPGAEGPIVARGGSTAPGDLRGQLKAGFMRAGRQDLAAMVDDPDFDTWIKQESGWNPYAKSPANNQGKPNYGLFQFWAGHGWARPDMNPEEQAYTAATKFRLDPGRIRGFASAIRSGRYKGWG
jgi:hypothetical protein